MKPSLTNLPTLPLKTAMAVMLKPDEALSLYDKRMIRLAAHERGWAFDMHSQLDAVLTEAAAVRESEADRDQMKFDLVSSTFVISQAIGAGLKVFRPTAAETEALANTEVRVPFDEYAQPFRTLAVEFPEPYRRGERLGVDTGKYGTVGMAGVLMHHDPMLHATIAVLVTSAGAAIGFGFWPNRLAAGATVEEAIAGTTVETQPGDVPIVDSIRVGFNAATLLVRYGCVKVGYDNPAYAARLKRQIDKGNKHAAANRAELRAIPVVYRIDQHIQLYREEKEAAAGDGPGDAQYHVRPHWRMGHWANQPCGPGGADRKRVLRPAVLVNRHMFGGRDSDTNVTVTT